MNSIEQWKKNPGCLGVILRDEVWWSTTQVCGDYFINHDIRVPIKQPYISMGKFLRPFFFGDFFSWRWCRPQVYLKKGSLYFLSSKTEALKKLQDAPPKWSVELGKRWSKLERKPLLCHLFSVCCCCCCCWFVVVVVVAVAVAVVVVVVVVVSWDL